MKKYLILFLFTFLFPMNCSWGSTLTVFYFKRPPYYETVDNRAQGFLVEMTKQIFTSAGVETYFKEIPPLRIMLYIKDANKNVCSIGWFKNKERETFAKFSLPIYQNKPLVILTIKSKQHLFEKHDTIRDVFADRSLILAKIDSFSYGTIMDEWINNYAPPTHVLSSRQSLLPRLILTNRATYMLIAPEEIDMMLEKADFDKTLFVSISKKEIPQGNKRYIIFSKGVDDTLINRINTAIEKRNQNRQ